MIRDALSNIGGIGIYGVVSIALFFATFISVLVWAFRLKKPWLQTMSKLPLEPNDDDDTDERESSHTIQPHCRHD